MTLERPVLAYHDADFLASDEARPLRIMAEYLQPLRAFRDARVGTWTMQPKRDQIHVPAALIAAAGVARLTMAEQEVVFDIPTLLDATLELCEAAGHG